MDMSDSSVRMEKVVGKKKKTHNEEKRSFSPFRSCESLNFSTNKNRRGIAMRDAFKISKKKRKKGLSTKGNTVRLPLMVALKVESSMILLRM